MPFAISTDTVDIVHKFDKFLVGFANSDQGSPLLGDLQIRPNHRYPMGRGQKKTDRGLVNPGPLLEIKSNGLRTVGRESSGKNVRYQVNHVGDINIAAAIGISQSSR